MNNLAENEKRGFLSTLFTEDLYLIDDNKKMSFINDESDAVNELPATKAEIHPQKIVPVVETTTIIIPQVAKIIASGIVKKAIIMVGYQGIEIVPPPVSEALSKIFEALKLDAAEIEIINILSDKAPKIEDYQFKYLILMGGNGKNLSFMQNYTGVRNKYDIIKHGEITVFFAEAMDIYLKNVELKRKFWNKLKELFQSASN